MLKIFKKIYWLALLALIFYPNFLLAAEEKVNPLGKLKSTGKSAGIPATTAEIPTSPVIFIGYLVQMISAAFGMIFMIRIIIAGVTWMTAGGNEEQLKKAHTAIFSSVIGLAIVLGAFAISYFVVNMLA